MFNFFISFLTEMNLPAISEMAKGDNKPGGRSSFSFHNDSFFLGLIIGVVLTLFIVGIIITRINRHKEKREKQKNDQDKP